MAPRRSRLKTRIAHGYTTAHVNSPLPFDGYIPATVVQVVVYFAPSNIVAAGYYSDCPTLNGCSSVL